MPGGLGSISPISFGSLVSAAQPSPFMQIMQGISALPSIMEQGQLASEESQFKRAQMQEMRERMHQAQMQNAQSSWDQSIDMLKKNPNLAQSPAMKQRMTQLSGQLGIPLPLDSRGNIDPSVYGTAFTDLMKDSDFQQRWWGASPQGRRTMRDTMNIQGVSDSAINAAPVLSPKEQNLVDKFHLSATDTADRIKNRDLVTQYQAAVASGRVDYLTAEARAAGMRAQADVLNAQAHMKSSDAAMQRANQEIQVAEIRARGHGTSDVLMRQYLGSAQRAHDRFKAEADGYSAQVKAAIRDGTDSDTVNTLQQKADNYYQMAHDMQTRVDTLNAENSTQPATKNAVTRQSGAQSVNVQTKFDKSAATHGKLPNGQPGWQMPDGSMFTENGQPYNP